MLRSLYQVASILGLCLSLAAFTGCGQSKKKKNSSDEDATTQTGDENLYGNQQPTYTPPATTSTPSGTFNQNPTTPNYNIPGGNSGGLMSMLPTLLPLITNLFGGGGGGGGGLGGLGGLLGGMSGGGGGGSPLAGLGGMTGGQQTTQQPITQQLPAQQTTP